MELGDAKREAITHVFNRNAGNSLFELSLVAPSHLHFHQTFSYLRETLQAPTPWQGPAVRFQKESSS